MMQSSLADFVSGQAQQLYEGGVDRTFTQGETESVSTLKGSDLKMGQAQTYGLIPLGLRGLTFGFEAWDAVKSF